MRNKSDIVMGLVIIWFSLRCLAENCPAEDWPQFRGVGNRGVASAEGDLPETWDGEQGENVAWKARLPGVGPSSPIVVDGRVFVTSSDGRQQSDLHVMAWDAASGRQIWKRTFKATGRTLTHPTSANAAPTPAADGKHIVAFFSSNDLICLDHDGNLNWYRGLALDYPKLGNDIGMASSPLIVGDTVIVQAESQGDSLAVGIDLVTGANRWKVARERKSNWCSPAVFHPTHDAPQRVLLQSGSGITAHDPMTGDLHWQFDAECDRIPSPVSEGHRVFVPAGGMTMLTVQADEPEIAWDSSRLAPGSSSPVVHQGRIYTVNRGGLLNCADAEDGELLWKMRLGLGRQWATPALSGNRLYCFDTDGKAAVVDVSREEGRVLSNPELGEPIKASPAIVDDAIYVRGEKHLWKISKS